LVKKAKPVFKNLGPTFGSYVNQVSDIIRGFDTDEIEKLEKGESIRISLDNGKHGEVTLNDVEIISESKHGLVVQTEGDITVALDTKLTEDLVAEGLAREFINRIQNMRKDAGFEVTDRIKIFYEASPALHRAVRKKEDYIKQEVLATEMTEPFKKADFDKSWEIDNEKSQIGIQRIN